MGLGLAASATPRRNDLVSSWIRWSEVQGRGLGWKETRIQETS